MCRHVRCAHARCLERLYLSSRVPRPSQEAALAAAASCISLPAPRLHRATVSASMLPSAPHRLAMLSALLLNGSSAALLCCLQERIGDLLHPCCGRHQRDSCATADLQSIEKPHEHKGIRIKRKCRVHWDRVMAICISQKQLQLAVTTDKQIPTWLCTTHCFTPSSSLSLWVTATLPTTTVRCGGSCACKAPLL